MSSSSPKDPNKDKWWNEWPLEGPDRRPAVFITKLLSKSPLLIGWDDERIEREAMEALSKATGEKVTDLSDLSGVHFGPKKEQVEEVTFGLRRKLAEAITNKILNLEVLEQDDDEEHGKKTLKEIGGSVFDEEAETSTTMRDTELYKLAFRNLQWQRDNYLVGSEYADERKQQRRMKQRAESLEETMDHHGFIAKYQIPYDATALGNIQLGHLGSWFIPSRVVHTALLPLVTVLPAGPLHQPILRATANLIPLSQENLDHVVKEQLLWFFDNQQWRDFIKSNTKGYISNTYAGPHQNR